MADVGDVLRHLVDGISPLSDANREEFLDAVNAEYPPPEPPAPPEPELTPAEVAAKEAAAEQATELARAQARVAELEARLARG